jgi:hypothetical protein
MQALCEGHVTVSSQRFRMSPSNSRQVLNRPSAATRPPPVPRWLVVTYTVLVCVLAPVFALHYGVTNFLWFSNVALFGTLMAILLRNRLLMSIMALMAILPDTAWNVAFFGRLVFGIEFFGMVEYMFSPQIPLWTRLISLYHVPLPFLLIWLVWRWGYDSRALRWQVPLAWILLVASYFIGTPQENINLVYGLQDDAGQFLWDPPLALLALMVALPLLIYLPTHLVLKRVRGVDPQSD